MSLLRISGLTVEHQGPGGTVRAVDGVSLALPAAGTLVLLGESGSGKSTVARAVLGLARRATRTSGSVLFEGAELVGAGERALGRIRGRRIGYVAQDPTASLDPLRTVGRQIAEVLRRHGEAAGRRAARAAVPALLEAAGVADPERVAASLPHQLSGGQRQRAAIALAVACRPALLVADEPTTALDVLLRARVLELFARLRDTQGTALLLVTHDLDVARRAGGEVAVLSAGRLTTTGPASQVLGAAPEFPHVPTSGQGGGGPRVEGPGGGGPGGGGPGGGGPRHEGPGAGGPYTATSSSAGRGAHDPYAEDPPVAKEAAR
ncbi:ABC transporter ATP-binding protein [Streptomyces lichenis]|uniref:ABC transporter ATP-binding protein n=1 Tax=Streptomyces lichenis TaxID=2306967 RepID=A0ABT0I8H9_9ACTN|nr:ABC transporter ATP-binding protein [Streptomyces lichenis]MCK8677604.1 ABC transporter ATP-binding protein [Streptomyces lichenis]